MIWLPLVLEMALRGCYWPRELSQQEHWVFSLGPWATSTGLESRGREFRALSPCRCRLFRAISSLAMSMKTSSMFLDSLADVSKTARRPCFSASVQASSNRTCRFSHRSHLFPGSERQANIALSNLTCFVLFFKWTLKRTLVQQI